MPSRGKLAFSPFASFIGKLHFDEGSDSPKEDGLNLIQRSSFSLLTVRCLSFVWTYLVLEQLLSSFTITVRFAQLSPAPCAAGSDEGRFVAAFQISDLVLRTVSSACALSSIVCKL